MQPTSNLIELAAAGARYLRRLPNGLYVVKPGKAGSTHLLKSTRPHPRILSRSMTPPRVVRCAYADPANFVEFPDTPEGREQAKEWVADRLELARNAAPLSAVAVPRGRAYKNFVQRRTEAAANGSLYEKKKPARSHIMANKKPTKTSTEKDQQNGITRPKEGTITRKVWDAADKTQDRAKVFEICRKAKINDATIATQYGKWRAYNGITGRSGGAKAKPAKASRKAPPPPPRKSKPAKPARPAKPAATVEAPPVAE